MTAWVEILAAACLADQLFQISACIFVVSILVNAFFFLGINAVIDSESARRLAGRVPKPVSGLLPLAVSAVMGAGAGIVTAAVVLKHAIFG